jgi:hypothetical protein
MIYTHRGRSLARVAFWLGLAQTVYSIFAPMLIQMRSNVSQLVVNPSPDGLSEGLTLLFCGAVLGVLCEISTSLSTQAAAVKAPEPEARR